MIQENEVLMFIIGCIVLIFSFAYYKTLSKTPYWIYLFLSYIFFLIAWGFTIAEGFMFPVLFDYIEHGFYSIATIMILLWIWKSTLSTHSKMQD